MHNKWQGDSLNVRNQKAKTQGLTSALKTEMLRAPSNCFSDNKSTSFPGFWDAGCNAQCFNRGTTQTLYLKPFSVITLPHKLVDCVVTKQGEENGFCVLLELRKSSVSLQGDVSQERKRHCCYNLSLMFVCSPNRFSSLPLNRTINSELEGKQTPLLLISLVPLLQTGQPAFKAEARQRPGNISPSLTKARTIQTITGRLAGSLSSTTNVSNMFSHKTMN